MLPQKLINVTADILLTWLRLFCHFPAGPLTFSFSRSRTQCLQREVCTQRTGLECSTQPQTRHRGTRSRSGTYVPVHTHSPGSSFLHRGPDVHVLAVAEVSVPASGTKVAVGVLAVHTLDLQNTVQAFLAASVNKRASLLDFLHQQLGAQKKVTMGMSAPRNTLAEKIGISSRHADL